MRRLNLVGLLVLALSAMVGMAAHAEVTDTARQLDPERRFAAPMDRDGDGQMGEETAIKERIKAYIDRHGTDGVLTGRQMLARARAAHAEWLEDYRKNGGKAITGDGWISMGPINGAGRAAGIAPHPTETGVLLQGSASGGVWKTLDGGLTWYPTTDGLPDLAIGAVAWAPSNPDIAYAGTGEGDILIGGGSGYIPGIGLLRSDDGGETWVIPDDSEAPYADVFFHIDVDPDDENTLFAATEKGVIKTTDGGASWETILSSASSRSYAYVEISRSSQDPDVMYAAQWCEVSCPDGTDRVMKSTDRGVTWMPTANDGLPGFTGYTNRPGFAMAPSDHDILYIAMNTTAGSDTQDPKSEIFRSDDGGETWTATANTTPYLGYQGWYDNTITVHPDDPDVVVAGGVYYVITSDGGQTWKVRNPYASGGGMGTATLPHVDGHDLQWQGDTLWLACDGGVWFSEDDGNTWTGRNDGVVTRQYYGIAVDPVNRERVLGGTQDNGTDLRRDIGDDTFDTVLGGDGFECAINPMLPDIYYATIYRTSVYRSAPPSNNFSFISPPYQEDAPFITPLTLHPARPQTVFTGTTMLWRSDNGGDSWFSLPKDIVADVPNGVWSPSTLVWAIAASPTDPERIAVSKGGTVLNSDDGGRTWTMAIMPRTAINVEISPHDSDLVLTALRTSGPSTSAVMRSTDAGATFVPSGAGLPGFNVQVIRFDPTDPDVVYAGTDVGLYRSVDAGVTWSRVDASLPAASVNDLRILPDGSMLRVGTYGRGIWELAVDQPENTPPTIEITAPTSSIVSVNTGDILELEATATDADGDPLSVSWFTTLDYELSDPVAGSGQLTTSQAWEVTSGGKYQLAATVTDTTGAKAVDYLTVFGFESGNDCATPRQVPATGPFPYQIITSNEFAARAESDPVVPCVSLDTSDPDSGRNGSIWFEFTPAETGTYSVSTCGSEADTILSVWTGDTCGPYEAVSEGCNDDDESVHCFGPRTDSYLELGLEAGTTYRILVGSWTSLQGTTYSGQVGFQLDCLTCASTTETEMVLPAVSRAEGLEGTTWATDAVIFNPTAEDAEVELRFLPQLNETAPPAATSVTVGAGQSMSLPDLVGQTFSYEGSGAVVMRGPDGLLSSSRTYNNAASGTFGQYIPAAAMGHAVEPGASVRLIGLAENDAFRTNIGFANPGATDTSVTIDLLDADGSLLEQRQEAITAGTWRQFTRIFNGLQGQGIEAASAVISNDGGSALFVYASIVDGNTGDPTYVTPVAEANPGEPVWIAASANATGEGDSVWRTDLELANGADVDVTVAVELMIRRQDNSTPATVWVEVPAGSAVKVADALATLFEFSGAAALRLSVSDGPVAIISRTYNLADTGTFGQFIPAVTLEEAAGPGDEAYLIQLSQNEAFRANIGIVNVTDANLRVEAEFFAADGTLVTSNFWDLPPHGYFQDSDALGSSQYDGGFAILTTSTPDGRFLAYASIVDNASDDPIFIPAQVNP